ncbi:glutamate racemase [Flocculibacter collagenilyticus]|uniref:glutamate racemase n=1 Tax=Flocculibacter collagenilyticus TaxID=2744479 RepID=UPI0018F5AC58|nr:glutamate racemase [Flocculibacter collagenilyticus]
MNSTKKIAILDSGIGGLTIYEELDRTLKDVEFHYLMDNRYLPYGELDADKLIERVFYKLDVLLQDTIPDLVVVACNTASTQVLDKLREKYSLPFVGVVPAIKPAAELSTSKHLCLLATPATINGDYVNNLILEFASECKITRFGSSKLVEIAELQFWSSTADTKNEQLLLELIPQECYQADTVVLGCTHFPMLKPLLVNMWPEGTKFIDSGAAIARRVKSLLYIGTDIEQHEPSMLKEVERYKGKHHFYMSAALTPTQIIRLNTAGFKHFNHI